MNNEKLKMKNEWIEDWGLRIIVRIPFKKKVKVLW